MTIEDNNTYIRVSKYLSEKGICSRREADSLIEQGFVFVNGKVAVLGEKCLRSDEVTLKDRGQKQLDKAKTVMINKPAGYVSSQPEEDYKDIKELITFENYAGTTEYQDFHHRKLSPAGRLDIESTGLLILSQNGAFIKKVIDINTSIEKEYLVRFQGKVSDKDISAMSSATNPLYIDDKKLKPMVIERIDDNLVKMILTEGKKRQIRRVAEQFGLNVTQLKRVRIGNIKLGPLPLGKWTFIDESKLI